MTARPAVRHGTAAALITILVSACGVPIDDAAEPLPANYLPLYSRSAVSEPSPAASPSASPPAPTIASPTPSPSDQPHSARLRLWFVQDDGLVAAESDLGPEATTAQILDALAAGPVPTTDPGGPRTVARDPLSGLPMVTAAETQPSTPGQPTPSADDGVFYPQPAVAVRLGPAFTALPPAEQVLLLGQVVLSLAGSGRASIAFTDDAGTAVAVPLPDGRLLDGPATARDYTSLIVRP